MTERKSLLIELGCEELPPKALAALAEAFAGSLCVSLEAHGIAADLAAATTFSTPRRLALHVPAVAGVQPEQHIERRGPALTAALDGDGEPTRALLGFAKSCGVEPATLERLVTDQGAWFVHRAVQPGRPLAALLPAMLQAAIKALPVPRPMRWGDHDYSFVRPVRWLVALHGAAVLDVELMGVASGRLSRGHRFHHPRPVHVADADSWADALRAAHVEPDPARRRQRIAARCEELAAAQGLRLAPMRGAALLRELVNITEWPEPIECRFDADFLQLPSEVLRSTMELDQRFMATEDLTSGALSPVFFGIANIESGDPAQIRQGYERVIRPRFADARFFYEADLQTPLAELQPALEQVTYQKALGSVWDKCLRVAELARVTAHRVGVDGALATRAATLAKCDLLTRMVGEFPELQGVMGFHYARAQGEPAEVARALDEFYMPRHAGDAIAATPLAQVLAVAERIDTLAGIFAVGMKPTGNKDPYALRRAALGLARTLIEAELDIDLRGLFIEALELLPEAALLAGAKKAGTGAAARPGALRAALVEELAEFVLDRLHGYYLDQGFDAAQFEAVRAVGPRTLPDFDRRLRAVAEFAALPEAAALAAANKRVGNILRKQAEAGAAVAGEMDAEQLEEPAERALAAALAEHGAMSQSHCAAGDYAAALRALAALRAPVDRFFDEVLVLADDPDVRRNRLALLAALAARFTAIADIARLGT